MSNIGKPSPQYVQYILDAEARREAEAKIVASLLARRQTRRINKAQ
jgi:hypothetical protein